jgi:regulator of sirC expression with transglutaminase-like and TPR domain
LTDQHLEAASPRALLLRLIENLKQHFWRKRDWNAVERSLRLQRTLTPSAPQWSLQTASVKEMRGDLEAAQQIYRSIIETTSDQELKAAAMKRLTAMGASKSTLH